MNLKEKTKLNNEDRMWYVKYWAKYVTNNVDKEWSRQQKRIIDAQIKNSKNFGMTPKTYLKIKGEVCYR